MAGKIDTIIFDKTGTLTNGKLVVTDVIPVEDSSPSAQNDILQFAASLEKQSEHPLAEAIYNYAKEEGIKFEEVKDFKAIPGKGVSGKMGKIRVDLGNREMMKGNGITIGKETELEMEKLENQGKTVMMIAVDKKLAGLIAVADTIKETTREAIERLERKGIDLYMITGDNQRTAKAIASQVGIEADHVFAEVLPEGKSEIIKNLKLKIKNSHRRWVAMVGDGINDAPALAQADLGIAMGSGTDVALETGGIVIMKNDLRDVNHAIQLAKETMGKIKQNMFFALFYNVMGIPIAARVFSGVGIILRPELAGLAMALSSISVVSNSLLLRNYRHGKVNYLSAVAPAAMILIFSLLFFQFARLSSTTIRK